MMKKMNEVESMIAKLDQNTINGELLKTILVLFKQVDGAMGRIDSRFKAIEDRLAKIERKKQTSK